jgi:hypothetical protein
MQLDICDYQGVISGGITIYERCNLVGSWTVHLECGHTEVYCTPHREEFFTLLGTAAVVCSCGVETHNTKIGWKKFLPVEI